MCRNSIGRHLVSERVSAISPLHSRQNVIALNQYQFKSVVQAAFTPRLSEPNPFTIVRASTMATSSQNMRDT